MSDRDKFNQVVSLAKRRGFIFPGSQIYGGLANTYDFGPLGVELLRQIQNHWWQYFVTSRTDMYGLDTSILMSPQVWEASGHTASFTDMLIDCKSCQHRTRADHVIEDWYEQKKEDIKVEGWAADQLDELIAKEKILCPVCGKHDWTKVRAFNLLFETKIGILPDKKAAAYLRGEIAQGMFVNFKNVLDTMSPKLPFGLAQQGKAFRNEITLGNFVFRTLEFNLSEFEYFFDPNNQAWEELFEYWKEQMWQYALSLGLSADNLRWRAHTDDERSHYSTRTEDLEYNFPFGGYKELFGLAYRTDFDLKNHTEKSGVDLSYRDPFDNKRNFIPHVIEPTFGINRVFLAQLCQGFTTKADKVVLQLKPRFAPYAVAVFPLLKNKPELVNKATQVYEQLKQQFAVTWDTRGNIGKRYASQDEIGTPFCITIDFETLDSDTVTVRDRDTGDQERVSIDRLEQFINQHLK